MRLWTRCKARHTPMEEVLTARSQDRGRVEHREKGERGQEAERRVFRNTGG